MKRVILVGLVVLLLAFTACNNDGGNVLNHLNNQDPGGFHDGDAAEADDDEAGTILDQLGDNLIKENESDNMSTVPRSTCTSITKKDIGAKELERRAIAESNRTLCEWLPNAPLILDCAGGSPEVVYSKARCLSYFGE